MTTTSELTTDRLLLRQRRDEQAVMRRLGMTHDPVDDFDDPTVPVGPLRRSVLCRIGGLV